MKRQSGLVYSTDVGRVCPDCGRPAKNCECAAKKRTQVKGDGVVRIRLERGGRGGKTVSAVYGVPLNQDQLKDLLREFKAKCGTGGTVKDGVIELQGDHCDFLISEMKQRGYDAKRAGG